MPSYVTPKKNTEFIFYVSLVGQSNTKTMQSNPTIATGDFKVSIDGGALANLTTLPAVTPASSKMVKITLSTSEMNGDNITVVGSDVSGAEWCDLVINIQTSARQVDDLAYPATSGRSLAVDASGQTTVGAIANAAITAAAIATDAIDADALATDAVSEIQAGLATAADLATVDGNIDAIVLDTNELQTDWTNGGRLDLLIDAIKAKTDNLPAAPAATGDIPSAAVIADAVWDESATGHTDAGKAGEQLWTDVDAILADTADMQPKLGAPAGASVSADIAAIKSETAAIVADTNEVQAELADGGRLDLLVDGIKAKTDNLPAAPAATGDIPSAAAIRAEVDSNSTQLAAIVADTNEVQAELADGGRLDLLIDGIKAVTDALPDSGALTALLANVAAILADTGTDGVVLSTATQQAIADVLLGRSVANVEDTAGVYTVAALILAAFESSIAGSTWTINKTDGTTTFATRTVTTDAAADPITGVS